MSNKKQRRRDLNEFLNPHILTLDQALKLSEENSTDADATRRNAARAVSALRDRVTCRFTGPSNFGRLTYGERMIWDLTYMQGEVLNGGFHQYLTNSTGETSEDVKAYLQDIGAVQTLELFNRLSKLFPGGKVPRDRAKRCAIVEEWADQESGNDVFDELDRCFYCQNESLDTLILAYVRKHRAEFFQPSEEVVMELKRKDRITLYCCGNAQPEWAARAEEALDSLRAFSKTAEWKSENKAQLKSLAIAGKKNQAIRLYKRLFTCSTAEAKAAVEQMLKSKAG